MTEEDAATLLEGLGAQLSRDLDVAGKPVIRIGLFGAQATEADLECLAEFQHVRSLVLAFLPVTDSVLQHLGAWHYLENLRCGSTRIAGHGFRNLHKECPLQDLDLSGEHFDPTALKHLSRFSALQNLQLRDTRIADADLEPCLRMHHLQELHLGWTGITDAALSILGQMTSLRRLSLQATRVTDDGLLQLAGLVNLEELNLVGCPKITAVAFPEMLAASMA